MTPEDRIAVDDAVRAIAAGLKAHRVALGSFQDTFDDPALRRVIDGMLFQTEQLSAIAVLLRVAMRDMPENVSPASPTKFIWRPNSWLDVCSIFVTLVGGTFALAAFGWIVFRLWGAQP